MKLKCDLIIQNLNTNNPSTKTSSNQYMNPEKLHKSAIVGLYRPKLEDEDTDDWSIDKKTIILTIETKTHNLKYKLKRLEISSKFVNDGKASLKLVDENIYLLISNTPSLTLINFINFLRIKMSKSNTVAASSLSKSNNKENKFVNKLLSNVQCTIPLNQMATISPLCEKEVNEALNGKKQPCGSFSNSPITSRVKKPFQNVANNLNSQTRTNQSPASLNKSKMPRCASSSSNLLVQLTEEQKFVLKSIREGNNVFFTGSGGVGKSFLINLIQKRLVYLHLYLLLLQHFKR
jgi:hypothetical protein